jgi:hypothetical protein
MARPTTLQSTISPVIEEFARQLSVAVERFTTDRIGAEVKGARRPVKPGLVARRNGRGASRRARILCYFPGCKNIAAPRFGMFCAAEHKKLPKAEKEKYRAQYLKKKGA